jgi:hypothetical protein
MSGGVRRVRLDGVADFLALRRETFGFELAPRVAYWDHFSIGARDV